MNHTTLGTILAISMVAALAIVGVSMLSPTKVQAVSLRLGDFTLDASNGASIRGLDGLSLDTNDQPSAPEK